MGMWWGWGGGEAGDIHLHSIDCVSLSAYLISYTTCSRLSFTCFCELAHLYTVSSKQAKPVFKLPKTPKHTEGSSVPGSLKSPAPSDHDLSQFSPSQRRHSVRSVMSVTRPPTQEKERMTKAEREWMKERGRESYLAWCMTKSAMQCHVASQQFRALCSELHNEDITKQLTDKMLDDLPDFALFDLCPQEHSPLNVLAVETQVVPPIEVMLPSAQCVDTTNLTWFKVLVYFRKLLQSCFWQKGSLHATNSCQSLWNLHYNELTPSTYSKCKALLSFLSQHCPPFRSCHLPSLPPLLALSSAGHQRPSGGTLSASGQQIDSYLSAADSELTVMWTKSMFTRWDSVSAINKEGTMDGQSCVEQGGERNEVAYSEDISGYFVLNQKSVRTSMPPNLSSYGFESHTVRMSVKKLSELYALWQELATASKAVLVESRSCSRALSRSPSKQKKMEKPFRVPPDLVESLETAVVNLAEALGSKLTKEQIPKLELQSVAAVAQVLEPFAEVTVKGEAYQFFRGLFNPSQS